MRPTAVQSVFFWCDKVVFVVTLWDLAPATTVKKNLCDEICTDTTGMVLFIYLFIYYLQPSQPHRVTSELFTKLNLTKVENNTKHALFTNVKPKYNQKVSPFGIALIKNSK